MNERQNLSADLTRIGEWLSAGETKMARQFLNRDLKLYQGMKGKIGHLPVTEFLKKIDQVFNQKQKAAELALTGAEILLTE